MSIEIAKNLFLLQKKQLIFFWVQCKLYPIVKLKGSTNKHKINFYSVFYCVSIIIYNHRIFKYYTHPLFTNSFDNSVNSQKLQNCIMGNSLASNFFIVVFSLQLTVNYYMTVLMTGFKHSVQLIPTVTPQQLPDFIELFWWTITGLSFHFSLNSRWICDKIYDDWIQTGDLWCSLLTVPQPLFLRDNKFLCLGKC